MTAGAFIMSNMDGLFSPFRDLEAEMDELRTMRRVSQIWQQMESRDDGSWMMFGRFVNQNLDDAHEMASSAWTSREFPHSHHSRLFGERDSDYSVKPVDNVVIEFPDEEEAETANDEPSSVVITEVEEASDSPVTTLTRGSSTSSSSRNSSPSRKPSLITLGENNNAIFIDPEQKSSFHVSSVSRTREEHSVRSVEINGKNDKYEKRLKKVDFSKTEVHFEPGSGKVNIVETNEKPPSNQLFRRKKRHREKIVRSESPKLYFVGSSEAESYGNVSPKSYNYDDGFEIQNDVTIDTNFKFSQLQNDLDLSIFNLRNSLFKSSINNNYEESKSKNLLVSPPDIRARDESNYSSLRMKTIPIEKICLDKNFPDDSSYDKPAFNVSMKLQSLIQNSIKNQMNLIKSQTVVGVKEINTDRSENQISKDKSPPETTVNIKLGNNASPADTFKSRSHSLKRISAGKSIKESTVTVVNDLSGLVQQKVSSKQSVTDDKNTNRNRTPVNRADSFNKNSRVTRQESLKSTSSRGSSVNSDKCIQKRNNLITKDSPKRESSRVNRLSSSSLKRGGIYVDGTPRKTKGATVTLINDLIVDSKRSETSDKDSHYNKVTVNRLDTLKNSNRVTKKDSFRSHRSKESSVSSQNKIDQKKYYSKKESFDKESEINSLTDDASISDGDVCRRISATRKKTSSQQYIEPKTIIYKNVPSISKLDSIKSDSSHKRVENIVKPNSSRIKRLSTPLDNKYSLSRNVSSCKDPFKDDKFVHENSSLFRPIKKEQSIHPFKTQGTDIKTPVAIRKKSSEKDPYDSSTSSQKEVSRRLSRSNEKTSNVRIERERFSKSPASKLSLTSLRRSKEPLRSFEKISNGWVGRCNMSAVNRGASSETKWATKSVAEMRLTSHNSNSQRSRLASRSPVTPDPRPSSRSSITVYQQKQSMIKLSGVQTDRKAGSEPSTSHLKHIESRKRSRHIYTPSSVASQSSVTAVSCRRSSNYLKGHTAQAHTSVRRTSTPEPTPIYETLNSRRRIPSTTLAKRIKQPNPCCNI